MQIVEFQLALVHVLLIVYRLYWLARSSILYKIHMDRFYSVKEEEQSNGSSLRCWGLQLWRRVDLEVRMFVNVVSFDVHPAAAPERQFAKSGTGDAS